MDLPVVIADMDEGILASMTVRDPVTDVGALETFLAAPPKKTAAQAAPPQSPSPLLQRP